MSINMFQNSLWPHSIPFYENTTFFNQFFVAGCLALECHSFKGTNTLSVNQQILLIFPSVRSLSSTRIETFSVLIITGSPEPSTVSYDQ